MGGGVMLEVAPFMPWVRLVGLLDVDLFTLLGVAGEPSRWAWLAVVAGAAVIGAGVGVLYDVGETAGRVAAGVVAALVLLGGVFGVTRLVQLVTDSHGLAGVGAGIYLMGLSEVAVVAGVVLPRPRRAHVGPSSGPRSAVGAGGE